MSDWTHHGVTLLLGDVQARLAEVPDESVDCVVTSPPYWMQRDYLVDGQIGLEPYLEEHIDLMIQVFRDVRRVLKPDGVCFVNYGDCYASKPNGRSAADTKAAGKDDRTFRDKPGSTIQGQMKPKDLCLTPERFAIAMQGDGWWVRSKIIWGKPNPMPVTVKDRPATAHEMIWQFAKSPNYRWNSEAVKVPASKKTNARTSKKIAGEEAKHRKGGGRTTNGPARKHVTGKGRKAASEKQTLIGQKHSREAALTLPVSTRNLRDYEPAPLEVWVMATASFKEAHFATFPPELVERCLLAGCPPGGHVLDPFGGSGTTGLVAMAMGRSCTLIELSADYALLAETRIKAAWMGSVELTNATARPQAPASAGALFDWAQAPEMKGASHGS